MKRVITEEYENGQLNLRKIEEDGELKQYWTPIWACTCPTYCVLHPLPYKVWWQQPHWYQSGGTCTINTTGTTAYIEQNYGNGAGVYR